jgi:hypothetical protein
VYEEGPSGLTQIHDFNPGITESGLFWTTCIDPRDVQVNPGNGRASMEAEDMQMPDYFDFGNSLFDGPSLPGKVSFRIEWSKSHDKHRFRYVPEKWSANVVFNTARVLWEGETAATHYVTDETGPQETVFADVGHERNGVYFR